MDEMKRRILRVLADEMAAIESRDRSRWRPWYAVELDRLDLEAGPLWYPAAMFGDGEPLPERVRAQANVALRKLADEGLLVVTPDGGRRRAKLTPTGRAAVDAMTGAPGGVRCDE